MATEREVNIRLKADAKQAKELKVELKALTQEIKAVELGFKSNSITQKEASERFRDLAQRIKQTGANELELVDITQRLWHANNRVEIGFKSLATETIQANKALREINQEQRVGNALLGSLSGVLGGDAAGIIGKFQSFEDVVLRTSVAFPKWGSGLAAMAGGIAILATEVILIIDQFKELGRISEENAKRARDAAEYAAGGRLRDRQSASNAARQRLELLQSELGATSGSERAEVLNQIDIQKRILIRALQEELRVSEEKVKLQIEINKLLGFESVQQEKKKESKKAELEIEKQITKEKEEQAKRVNEMFLRDRAAGFGSIERLSPDTDIAGTIRGQVKGAKTPDKLGGVAPFVVAEKELGEFERAAIGSFSRVGLSLSSQLGRGFVDAFGIGHTVLGQFVEDFLSQMAQLAASKVLKGLFSLIPGVGGFLSEILPFAGGGMINEPVIGRGTRSGSIYTIAENEPEMVVPSSRMGNVGGGSQIAKALNNFANAFNNGSWRQMNGRDLVFVTENATLIEKRRRY